jgi:branched-chain amino acid transport system permease protein
LEGRTLTSSTVAGARLAIPRSPDGAVEGFPALSQSTGLRPGRLVLFAVGIFVGLVANDYWQFILQMSFIMGIVALGTLVVAGYAREITLMQASLTGTAVYMAGWAYRENVGGLKWPFPVALAFGTGAVVALSIFVAVISSRLSAIYVMVLTLGVQFTIENSLFNINTLTGGLQAPIVSRPNFFGISLRNERHMYFFLMAVGIILMILIERYRHSRFGRALLMVGNDQQAAAAVGINPWRYRISAFAIGGLFAGLGGAFWAPQLGDAPGTDQFMAMESLVFLAIPVFAGFDSVPVVFMTGMFFMALPMALEQYHFQPMLLGGVALMISVLLGPRGITGFGQDLMVSLRSAWAADGPIGVLKMIARPSRPRWLRMPNRGAARAYKQLRDEESTGGCWADDGRPRSAAIS